MLTVILATPMPDLAKGQNSCQWAFDNECDEARYAGSGACDDGTDAADCQAIEDLIHSAIPQGQDSCQYAFDHECDELRFGGTGACAAGTDRSDCGFLALGAGDFCYWAHDGECDEPRYDGSWACTDGSDASDCRPFASADIGKPGATPFPGGQDNSCQWAHDGECDESRYSGSGACDAGTDSDDCAAFVAQIAAALPGDNDTCEWAFDHECDDSRYGGTGACAAGTDRTDCAFVAGQPGDGCYWAQDGECDEPRFNGTGACADGTDTSDCGGSLLADGGKPGATPIPGGPSGNDTCQWAHDLECDEPQYGGTGACADGTDFADCRVLALGGDNSCQYAYDGECDEPSIGLGVCTSGTDLADCAAVAHLRNRDNACATAFDGVCDEVDGGNGTCPPRSDTVDCIGRTTVAGVLDHFFGRDDRQLMDTRSYPWNAIGQVTIRGGGACTATLIGPDVAISAAHCFFDDDGGPTVPEVFFLGLNGSVYEERGTIRRLYVSPQYDPWNDNPLGAGNGHDWAFFQLNERLGDRVGYMTLFPLDDATRAELLAGGAELALRQAGYSWDTGDHLSGQVGCRIQRFLDDHTFLHECDTTFGDSGSPLFVMIGNNAAIIGLDSQFIDVKEGTRSGYLAVAISAVTAGPYQEFMAGAGQNLGAPATAK